jgi:hypothetical protein
MLFQFIPPWSQLLGFLVICLCFFLEYQTRKRRVIEEFLRYNLNDTGVPKWVSLALQNRYDRVQKHLEDQFRQHPMRTRVEMTLQQCKVELEPNHYTLLLQLEQELMLLTSLEKERIYMKGVKDGASFLYSLKLIN